MSAKLFVGNLDYGVDTPKLKELFGEFGTVVDAVVLTDRETGRSRGFGFVTLDNDEAAKKAMEALNGKEVNGRNINVNEAKPQENR